MSIGAQLFQQAAQASHCHDIQSVGGLIQQDIAWPVYERSSQRGLDSLSLRKSLRNAVGKLAHLEQLDELVRARLAFRSLHSVKCAEIVDVFASREARIDTCSVRKHANPATHFQRI